MKTTLFTLLFFTLLFTGCSSNTVSLPKDTDTETIYRLAQEQQSLREFHQAAKLYRQAANKGHAGAQYSLGYMYSKAWGVNHDRSKAIHWYRKAAAQNNADAQYNLGVVYDKGYGVNQDYSQAMNWYLKAAKQNHKKALNNIGFMYSQGLGVPVNKNEANKWYSKATAQDSVAAKRNLTSLGGNTIKVPQKLSKRNTPMPSKAKAKRMADEMFRKFIYQSKYINHNYQSNVFMASLMWANNWAIDRTRLDLKTYNNFAKFQPSFGSKCYNLVNIATNNKSLMSSHPSLNRELLLGAKDALKGYKPLKFTGVQKYNVTPQQFHKIIVWQYTYGQPAICGCLDERMPDVAQFCRKYNYPPVTPLGASSF